MGKVLLAMPHPAMYAHPQLIPSLERGYNVDVHFEAKISSARLQQVAARTDLDALIMFGSLISAGQLAGLPPRHFALVLVNLSYPLPETMAKDPLCALVNFSRDSLSLQLWGQGERYVDLLCLLMMGLYANLQVDLDNVNFTEKEREVLRMLLQGLRDEYIARALFISPKTVRNHISNMLRKVRVDSRTQLVLWAMQKGKQ